MPVVFQFVVEIVGGTVFRVVEGNAYRGFEVASGASLLQQHGVFVDEHAVLAGGNQGDVDGVVVHEQRRLHCAVFGEQVVEAGVLVSRGVFTSVVEQQRVGVVGGHGVVAIETEDGEVAVDVGGAGTEPSGKVLTIERVARVGDGILFLGPVVEGAHHAGPLVDMRVGVGDDVAVVGVGLAGDHGHLVVVIQVSDVLALEQVGLVVTVVSEVALIQADIGGFSLGSIAIVDRTCGVVFACEPSEVGGQGDGLCL